MAVMNHELDPIILMKAKEEFLNFGFNKASMRNIAKSSGLTTGALYTRYKSKDDLFEKIILNKLNLSNFDLININNLYKEAKDEKNLDKFLKAIKDEEKLSIDFLFNNYDECVLLMCKSEGSKLGLKLNQSINYKCEQTLNFFKEMKSDILDLDAISIVMNQQFTYYRLILEHGYSKDKAISVMNTLDTFIEAGWKKLFSEIIKGE